MAEGKSGLNILVYLGFLAYSIFRYKVTGSILYVLLGIMWLGALFYQVYKGSREEENTNKINDDVLDDF